MESLVQKNRTPEYWEAHPDRLQALTLDDVNEIAVRLLDVERMVWTIAGDLSKIEPQLTGLDLGERQVLAPDGEQLYG
jgi:predicted Zn-dependent peptidase